MDLNECYCVVSYFWEGGGGLDIGLILDEKLNLLTPRRRYITCYSCPMFSISSTLGIRVTNTCLKVCYILGRNDTVSFSLNLDIDLFSFDLSCPVHANEQAWILTDI